MTKFQRLCDRLRFGLRARLSKTIRIGSPGEEYVFRCHTDAEAFRARTLFVKEQGTVEWIQTSVKPGDVFYDIGANIGIYTLVAAARVGPAGCVYAFEPHAANFASLLQNISMNRGLGRMEAIGSALHDKDGFFHFNYRSWKGASSTSQLDSQLDETDKPFQPVGNELKHSTTLDTLVESGTIRPPDLVKIDVDGNELLILRGMERILNDPVRPRAIQVEINTRYREPLFQFMRNRSFELAGRNYTLVGKQQIARGADPDQIPHNALFTRIKAS